MVVCDAAPEVAVIVAVPAPVPKNVVIAVPLSSIVTTVAVAMVPTPAPPLNNTDVPAGMGLPDVSYTIAVNTEDPSVGIVSGALVSSM